MRLLLRAERKPAAPARGTPFIELSADNHYAFRIGAFRVEPAVGLARSRNEVSLFWSIVRRYAATPSNKLEHANLQKATSVSVFVGGTVWR